MHTNQLEGWKKTWENSHNVYGVLKALFSHRRKSNDFSDELFCAGFIEALQGLV